MASQATKKASVSSHPETHEADEGCENIPPPGVSATTGAFKPKVQEGDVVDCPSTQPSGETKPLSDNCNFATPAPYGRNRGAKAKTWTSNLQSTLTPIFRYIHLGVKCQNSQSPDPLKHGEKCPVTGFSNGPSAQSSSHKDPPMFMLEDEVCPEITFLNDTFDSTMPVASPAVVSRHILPETPVSLREMVNKPEEVDDTNADLEMGSCVTLSEISSVLTPERENIVMNDSNCLRASLEVTRDIPTVHSLKNNGSSLALSGQNMAEFAGSVTFQSSAENSSTTLHGNVTHDTSSSGDKSAQCIISQSTASDMQCNNSSKNCTFEFQVEPMETSNSGEPNNTKVLTNHEDAITNKVPQPSLKDKDPPMFMLEDEVCPEITLLNDTVDSTMPVASPAVVSHILPETPVSLREMVNKPEEVDDTNADLKMGSCVTLSEISSVLTPERENIVMNDSNCLRASLEVTRDIPTVDGLKNNRPSLTLSGQNMAEFAGSVTFQSSAENSSTTLPGNVTHNISSSGDKSAQHMGKNMMNDSNCLRASMETTQDIPTVDDLKINRPSLVLGGQNMAEFAGSVTFQSSAENSSTTLPGNVTHDISSSSDKSAQCIISQSTASDIQCNKSSTNCTFEVQVEPMETSNSGEPNNTKVLTNHEDAITNKVPQPSLKAADSMSSTFTTLQPSELSTPTDLNTAVPISCPQNNTLVLPPSSPHNTMNMPSPKISNPTTNPTDNTFEGHPPGQSKVNGITAGTEAYAKTVDLCDGTFEAHPVVVPGAKRGEAKEHSQSGLPMTDGLSDTLGHQSMDMESNKADTFNLDDSLDLRSDSLVTSTPMPDSKMFNLIAGQGTEITSVVPKRLYGDGPGKIVMQAAASSNIANERAVPSAKSLLPPRVASRLLQYKPVSSVPASCKLPRQSFLRNTAASDARPQETTGTLSSCSGRAAVTGSKQPSAGLRRPRPSGIPSSTQRATPSLRPPAARSNVAASSANHKPFGPTVTNPMVSSQAPSQIKQHLFSRTEPLPITKKRKLDASVPSTSADDPVRGARGLKIPATSQRALPAKSQSHDASVSSTSADDPGRGARGLKIPATSQRALPAKSQSHGCADCAMYKEELERVQKELLNYKRRKDEC